MPTYYHNPENALKKANEFCELGKDDEALECLYNAVKSRKIRMMKDVHEMIISKLLELCVEHKKSQRAKEGLYCYRNLCQGINIKSWEDSVCKYLNLAENKVESAQEAFRSVILDVDDLDQGITPENFLKSVSSEGAQDRTERSVLFPWIKFLWETYRNCLDLLRNARSMKLYHAVAKTAFKFCVKFSRKSELRKLCNVLKTHAIYIQNKQAYLKTDDVETYLIFLDTGFVELESAIKMELWQDAFKAIENIHALMNVSKKIQHSKVMAHYYNKISCVFWRGKEYLFHAAANLRYFLILKEQKKSLNLNESTKLASSLVLSVLAVPPAPVNPTTDLIAETDVTNIPRKNKLLASLLNLSKCPTRSSLIKDVIQFATVQYLPKELANLFQGLENNSNEIFTSFSASINFIKNWSDGELEEYIPLIQKVFIAKLLPLLSNLYANIKMTKLLDLTGITQMADLEVMLVIAARRYELPLKIDHRNMCVHFPDDFNIFKNEQNRDGLLMEDSRSDIHLKWLIHVHSALKSAVKQIHPELEKNEHKIMAEKIAQHYFSEKESDRKSLLQRKIVIEKYKESLEKSRLKKEEDERRRVTEKLLQYEAAEKERLLRETEERKLQRLRQEEEEIKRKLFLEKMETFKKSVLGSQIVENLDLENIDSLDPQILFCKQVEQLNKEKKQLNLRLRRQERNFDHFERAKRIEEIPLLIEQYDKQKDIDIKEWNKAVKNKIDAAYKKREQEVRKKNRVLEIKQDLLCFLESVKNRNLELYKEEMAQFVKMVEEEKQKRLKKRANVRKQKRKEAWVRQRNIKAHKEAEIRNQGICKKKEIDKQHIKQKIVNNKYTTSLKTPVKTAIIDEISFGEDISNRNENNSYPEANKRKYNSTEISDGMHLSKSIYYYKTTYESDMTEAQRIEVHEKRASIFSEFSSDLFIKSKYQRSDFHHANDQRTETNILEKSNETLLTWRTPWARKDSYISQRSHHNKESEVPQQNITIMHRETRSEAANFLENRKDSDSQTEKLKSENQKSDVKHSCTPWAKLKRQATEK